MKKYHIHLIRFCFLLALTSILAACGSPAPTATSQPQNTATEAVVLSPTDTAAPLPIPTETFQPTTTATATETLMLPTDTAAPAVTSTTSPLATATETIGEMLKTRIIFYLILPEKGRTDACGDITVQPIITKRYRTGDRFADVQIALNMLLGMHIKRYGVYYNALWDTDLSIASTKYNRENDEMTIDFTGYLPINQLTTCDKHGIREEIWKTFYAYGISQKIFKYNGGFFIDQLNRK